MNKNERVLLLGDIHGDARPVEQLYKNLPEEYKSENATNYLILLGDSGCNYYLNIKDMIFKERLSRVPFIYFVIRGNHEQRPSLLYNKETWHMEEFWDNEVYIENDYPNIKYALDDVQIYNISFNPFDTYTPDCDISYQTLVIPGAYSVDKYYRQQLGWQWFPQEQLSEEEMKAGLELVQEYNEFDLVLSHTCPLYYEPKDLFLSQIDQSTVDKTMENFLVDIDSEIDYRAWCWGHFHAYRDYYVEDTLSPSISPCCVMLYNDKAIDIQELFKERIVQPIDIPPLIEN